MAHTKPILAVSSFGLGAALLLIAAQIQRDPLAFTAPVQGEQALTASKVLPPPERAAFELIPVVPLEALEVLPQPLPAPKARRPAPNRTGIIAPQPAPPPCNPRWRELESGPAGRMVREICPPPTSDDVPRS